MKKGDIIETKDGRYFITNITEKEIYGILIGDMKGVEVLINEEIKINLTSSSKQ